jgi:DNA primase
MQTGNLGFREAVEALASGAGLEVPQSSPQERERAQRQIDLQAAMDAAAGFFAEQLELPAGSAGRAYLAKRGLDDAAMRRFRLGFAPDSRDALKRALAGRSELRLFPQPRHLPDRRPQRAGHRLRRARHRRGPAEISQLAGDAPLPEGPRALWLGGGPGRSGAGALGDRD